MSGGIDDIIERYSKRSDTTVVVAGDMRYEVLVPKSAAHLLQLEKIVGSFVKACLAGNVLADQKPWLPQPKDIIRLAAWISQVSVNPKISLGQALQMSAVTGGYFLQVAGAIMTAIGLAVENAVEDEVDAEGEGLNGEDGSPNGPSLPATSTTKRSKN